MTEMDVERIDNESIDEVYQAIDRDGIHADDDQRKCPPFPLITAGNLNCIVKKRQQPETQSPAEQHPGGRPDALDDWADARYM